MDPVFVKVCLLLVAGASMQVAMSSPNPPAAKEERVRNSVTTWEDLIPISLRVTVFKVRFPRLSLTRFLLYVRF